MKKKSIITIVTLFSLLITFCGEKKDEFRERLNYYNSKYGFRITFPDNWINYSSFEIDEIIDPELKVTSIYFALPTRSREWQPLLLPPGYAALFSVRIFSKKQWELFTEKYGVEKNEINSADRKIGENETSVFMIKNTTSLPVDLYFFAKEVPAITGKFRTVIKD